MQKLKLLDVNLRLFDGAAGAAAGGEAAGGEAQTANSTLSKAETIRGNGSSRRSKSGEFSNIVFGSQDEADPVITDTVPAAEETKGEGNANKSGIETTSDTLEAKRKAFEDLIDGEYKDIYAEKFQNAFNRRFKEVKGLEQSLNDQKPIIDMLMQRYNIGDGDVSKLQQAIEQDNVYWEGAAEEAGLTVEQYKTMQKLERENAELRLIKQRQQSEQLAQQKLSEWYKQAEEVKQLYPSFDFKTESENKAFTDLLKANIPVKQAYELIHMEEIKNATARSAAQTAGEQMVAKIKGNASRPLENGTSSQSAALVKNDVHSLTRAERAEAVRRAQRGDKITFRGSR